jgi:hypothetical protein
MEKVNNAMQGEVDVLGYWDKTYMHRESPKRHMSQVIELPRRNRRRPILQCLRSQVVRELTTCRGKAKGGVL